MKQFQVTTSLQIQLVHKFKSWWHPNRWKSGYHSQLLTLCCQPRLGSKVPIVDSPPTSPPHHLPFHTIDFDESTDNILHGMARASVSPAQPRPGHTIEPVLAQNSTRIPNVTPEVDPISRAAKDPYLTAIAPEKACILLACRLADIIFGPDVLAHSNLTGRDDRTALNPPDQGHNQKTIW